MYKRDLLPKQVPFFIPTKIRSDGLERVWRIQIGADNDVDSQHELSIMNATDVGLEIDGEKVKTVDEARTAVLTLVEFDQLYRREKKNHPSKL